MNLYSYLADPRSTRRSNLPKVARSKVSDRIVELSVIEDIKEFGSDIHRDPFLDLCPLVERHIPVV